MTAETVTGTGASKTTRILICADVNPNLIDGSTIWLQSVARCFAAQENTSVTVLLREPLSESVVMASAQRAGASLTWPEMVLGVAGLPPTAHQRVRRAIVELDSQNSFDLVFVRGRSFILELLEEPTVAERIWAYWLDRPGFDPTSDPGLRIVVQRAARIVVQSELVASLLESVHQVKAERITILPPMVPEEAFAEPELSTNHGPLRLVYSGKLDANYNVEKYVDMPRVLAANGVAAEVVFIGNKFNRDPNDPDFIQRMRAKLLTNKGVHWLQGVEREAALNEMRSGTFGLCWRRDCYNGSLELSTKLLEFSALGVPPLLNRTNVHERLLGANYPYFVESIDDIVQLCLRAGIESDVRTETQAHITAVASGYSFAQAGKRLRAAIKRTLPHHAAPQRIGTAAVRLVVAGHDFKFLEAALSRLACDQRVEIRRDRWSSSNRNREQDSEAALRWGDVFLCEWCAGAAVWYSQRISRPKRCIVRLHRFELFEEYPLRLAFENVSRLIVVSEWMRDQCVSRFNWDPDRIIIQPQYVDADLFDRPKHAWASQTIGLVGINPFGQKRPDRAVEVLARLRTQDPRWRLRVRSVMPWDINWVWRRPTEQEGFRDLFRRLMGDPGLRDAVLFDPPGPDMPEWFRNVSYVLSSSDSEGCHTAVAEGMASGAIPLINAWPGAESVYPQTFVRDGAAALAALASEIHSDAAGSAKRISLARSLGRDFDIGRTVTMLTDMIMERT